jgi:hypothetical protein
VTSDDQWIDESTRAARTTVALPEAAVRTIAAQLAGPMRAKTLPKGDLSALADRLLTDMRHAGPVAEAKP